MLRAVSIVCAIAYWLLGRFGALPGLWIPKGLSIFLLAVLARQSRGPGVRWLAVALTFSAIGDVLLDLDPNYFTYGLGSFLLAHLAYILMYGTNVVRPWKPSRAEWIAAVCVVAFCGGYSAWLVPSLGPMTAPVIAYMAAITAMVLLATLGGFGDWRIPLGAMLFLLSDAILAASRFKQPVPGRDFLVWTTYYLGQFSIATGYLRFSEKRYAIASAAPAGAPAGGD